MVSVVSAGTASAAISNPTRHILAYVTEATASAVAVVDTQASPPAVLGTITLSATCHPHTVTSSPTLVWVYVGCAGRATSRTTHPTTTIAHGAIDVIDTATNTVTDTLPLTGADPIATAISPDGKTLYALSFAGTTGGTQKFGIDVLSINAGTPALASTVSLPAGQWVSPTALGALAVGDGGARVAVAASTTKTSTTTGGAVDVYTVASGSLTPTPHGYAFSSLAAWAVAFNPTHPTVLYVAPGDTATAANRRSITVITVVATTTATSQFSWSTVTMSPTGAGQIVVSPNGDTFAVSLTADGTAFVGPLTVTPATAKVLRAIAVPGATAKWAAFVELRPTATVPPLGAALTPGGTSLYVAMADYLNATAKTVPSQLDVLDAVTKVVATVTLGTTGAAGVAFGQPAAPAPTTTTTSSTTTTTVPPTTTTTLPATTTTTAPKGPQLAYTGEDVTPWLAAGGSLLAAGALLLVADARRRRPAHAHRRTH